VSPIDQSIVMTETGGTTSGASTHLSYPALREARRTAPGVIRRSAPSPELVTHTAPAPVAMPVG